MNFEDFLKQVSPKIGPKNAFDLARDSQLKALERVLIQHCGITQSQIDLALENELKQLSENIQNMPPLPNN
ncbi:MAG: hypothetical protein V4504_00190 [Patescibacteria group bacterium]